MSPTIGEIQQGYRFKGGNPSDQANWEPVNNNPTPRSQDNRPEIGAIQDGYRYVGGNPADQSSWEIANTDPYATTVVDDIVVNGHRASDKVGMAEAGTRGVAQGLTFGFADEAMAGLKSLPFVGNGKGWTENIENERNLYNQAKHDQPGAYTAGDVAGSIGGAFIPGLGLLGTGARGAGLAARVGTGMARGAVQGGLSGAGRSEGNVLERMDDTALGGALGGLTGGALSGAGPALSGSGRALNNGVNQTVKTIGNMTDNLGNAFMGGARGNIMRELGKPVDDLADGLIDRAAQSNPKLGSVLGDLYNENLGGMAGVRGRTALASVTGGASLGAEGAARGTAYGLMGGGATASSPGVQGSVARGMGGLAGNQTDQYQALREPETVLVKVKGTKYEAPLMEALSRGPDALRAQVFIMRNEPEFRRLVGIDLSNTGAISLED